MSPAKPGSKASPLTPSEGTIFPAPSPDPSKSATENLLSLTPLPVDGSSAVVFTNTRKLLHDAGVRGMYGGTLVAQCLHAAQQTLDPQTRAGFFPHSIHGSFIRAGNGSVPVVYEVENLYDGRTFAARRVTTKQNRLVVFVANVSLTRSSSSPSGRNNTGSNKSFEHEPARPTHIPASPSSSPPGGVERIGRWPEEGIIQLPLATVQDGLDLQKPPWERKIYRYMRTSSRISDEGGMHEHLAAMAFLSDGAFLLDSTLVSEMNGKPSPTADIRTRLRTREQVGMAVSLDHTIHFHRTSGFRADDWLLVERSSTWAGNERATVAAKIWGQDGRLVATCVQEVRIFFVGFDFHVS